MAINSVSKFEAVISEAQIKIQKVMHAQGGSPALEKAVRTLAKIEALARQPEKLKGLRDQLEVAVDSICSELSHDEELRNDMWDLTDYVDFRC